MPKNANDAHSATAFALRSFAFVALIAASAAIFLVMPQAPTIAVIMAITEFVSLRRRGSGTRAIAAVGLCADLRIGVRFPARQESRLADREEAAVPDGPADAERRHARVPSASTPGRSSP